MVSRAHKCFRDTSDITPFHRMIWRILATENQTSFSFKTGEHILLMYQGCGGSYRDVNETDGHLDKSPSESDYLKRLWIIQDCVFDNFLIDAIMFVVAVLESTST